MREILKEVKSNWANLKNDRELKIFQTFAEKGRMLIVLNSCNSVFVLKKK